MSSRDGVELTPEEEQEVSRLLAGLAGPLPTPPEVTARLDRTLADLQEQSASVPSSSQQAPGPQSGPQSRPQFRPQSPASASSAMAQRRRWPRVVLAAAAVVLGGYSVGSLLPSGGGAESMGAGGAGSDADSPAAADAEKGQLGSDAGDDVEGLTRVPEVRLRSRGFAADVRRELPRLDAAAPDAASSGTTRCATPPLERRDRWYLVRLDGELASLVLTPHRGGTLQAQAFSCASAERLARAEVAGPE